MPLEALFLLCGSLTIALGCLNASAILHEGMISRTFRLPMSFFDTTPIGRIVNRFAKDVDVVDNLIPMSIRTALLCFLAVRKKWLIYECSVKVSGFFLKCYSKCRWNSSFLLKVGDVFFVIFTCAVLSLCRVCRWNPSSCLIVVSH